MDEHYEDDEVFGTIALLKMKYKNLCPSCHTVRSPMWRPINGKLFCNACALRSRRRVMCNNCSYIKSQYGECCRCE